MGRASRGSSEIWIMPAPFRGWSVRGRAEAERRLDFSFSNFSVRFLRCWEQTGRSPPRSPSTLGPRGGRQGQQPTHAPCSRRALPRSRVSGKAPQGGRGRRAHGWTHPPALRPGRARGCGVSLRPPGAAPGARPGAPRLPHPPPPPTRAPVIGSARPWLRAEARLPHS